MKKTPIIPIIIAAGLALSSCARDEKPDPIATVNESRISAKELRKEASLASQRYPEQKITDESLERMLEEMIERKLLIQEAVKMGLSEDERFLQSIKAYWEQTLIRELIEAKNREWKDSFIVTDEEVSAHYARMRYRVTMRAAGAPSKEAAATLRERMLKGRVENERLAGPLFVEDISPDSPLYGALGLPEKETGIFEDDERYTVVQVVKKEEIPLEPLDEIYGSIKERLLEVKKQHKLAEWIEDVRKSAKIDVDRERLKRIKDE